MKAEPRRPLPTLVGEEKGKLTGVWVLKGDWCLPRAAG